MQAPIDEMKAIQAKAESIRLIIDVTFLLDGERVLETDHWPTHARYTNGSMSE